MKKLICLSLLGLLLSACNPVNPEQADQNMDDLPPPQVQAIDTPDQVQEQDADWDTEGLEDNDSMEVDIGH